MSDKKVTDLVVTENGLPADATLKDQLGYANFLIQSKMLPASYRSPEQVVAGMQMAKELGIKGGVKSLSRTAVINGSPSIFAEMPLAVCRAAGIIEDFIGYHFDKDLKKISFENGNINKPVYGYFCSILRTGSTTYVEEYYTLDQANKAGLLGRGNSPWNKHPEDMLKWRTIGKVLKVVGADVLTGVSIAEYDHNTTATPGMETVSSMVHTEERQESEINERFEESVKAKATEPVIIEAEEIKPTDTIVEKIPEVWEGSDEPTDSSLKNIADSETESIIESFGDYVIPIGQLLKGKKLKDCTTDELNTSLSGLIKYCGQSHVNDQTAETMMDNMARYLISNNAITKENKGAYDAIQN